LLTWYPPDTSLAGILLRPLRSTGTPIDSPPNNFLNVYAPFILHFLAPSFLYFGSPEYHAFSLRIFRFIEIVFGYKLKLRNTRRELRSKMCFGAALGICSLKQVVSKYRSGVTYSAIRSCAAIARIQILQLHPWISIRLARSHIEHMQRICRGKFSTNSRVPFECFHKSRPTALAFIAPCRSAQSSKDVRT
jgi:hypothetical protein